MGLGRYTAGSLAKLLFLARSGYPDETYHTFSYSPLVGDDATVAGILCVATEGTDRVLSERRMATLRELAAELTDTLTEDDRIATGRGLSLYIPVPPLRGPLGVRRRVGHFGVDGDQRRLISIFRDVTAEIAAAQRQQALANFGVRLAEASDVYQVREACVATSVGDCVGQRRTPRRSPPGPPPPQWSPR